MLERPVGLGLVIGQRFLEPLGLAPLIFGGLIEGAQRVLDALPGADWIVSVEVLAA